MEFSIKNHVAPRERADVSERGKFCFIQTRTVKLNGRMLHKEPFMKQHTRSRKIKDLHVA